MEKRIRIGDLLLKENLITEDQLNKILAMQKDSGKRFGEILSEMNLIQESELLSILSKQLKISIIDLATYPIKSSVSTLLPETYARKYQCILLDDKTDNVLLGMVDPLDIIAYDEVGRILKKRIDCALVSKKDLEKNLSIIYRQTTRINSFASELGIVIEKETVAPDALLPAQLIDAPVRKFIDALFQDALQVHASDIHIEPDKEVLRVRLRVDGMLQEQILDEKNIAPALSQRLKLMARLNMAEKRLPLDGRFTFHMQNKDIDVRLSTMPNEYGESIVMRLLDQTGARIDLNQCGMSEAMLEQFRQLIHLPHGVILITGPTGSGKTTTLYGALSEINTPETKIITIEDPVEYKLDRICQVQVKPKIGLDFSQVLRSALRQDPDIILVGEMRDQETASIAMRAALTGHLVLSTLHTNNTASTAIRLLDMGVPGYLVAATLECVIAQRLIRKICNDCKQPYQPNASEKKWLFHALGDASVDASYFIGKGCTYCNNVGYSSRMGIFEFLIFTEEMIAALARSQEGEFMKLAKDHLKGATLLDQAAMHAMNGITTIHEVIRVAGGIS